MGITGLLPLLKSIQQPCNLKEYKGKTLGVDGYGWLHRGTASCAVELALDKPTTKYVEFFMHRVRMLIHFGVVPYIVFDGDNLPSKAGTEKDRKERRKSSKALGLDLLKAGKTSQAHAELQKSVDVTPEMARTVIEELKHHNVQYVVAPYEADSQLCYLERKGLIDGVISEDSDLLVFGVRRLITKLDKYGECVEVNRQRFTACREVSFVGWSDADFRKMAILSGCDYLPGIGGLGLKTSHRMLRKHRTVERLVKAAQFDGKLKVPNGFLTDFDQAEKTFLYQWVFCPITQQLVNLTPLAEGVNLEDMPFIGEQIPAHLAIGVARGDLIPRTKRPISVQTKLIRSDKPLMPARRVSSVASTPDLKGIKPIDSFFKPKRTPLAELDPNCFTPSPSQQVLLQQQHNANGWAAVPAPLARLQQAAMPRTAPQPARRIVSAPVTGRRSVPNPSKRQRLCSDSTSTSPTKDDRAVVRSSFFASSTVEPSPSLRGRKARPSFELYSDDSIEGAMLEVADLQEAASQPSKKMRVFSDSQTSITSTSQSSIFSKPSTADSQETATTSQDSQEEQTVFSSAISSQISDLRSKFSYKSAAKEVVQTSTRTTIKSPPRRRHTEMWAPGRPVTVPDTPVNSERQQVDAIEDDGIDDDIPLFEQQATPAPKEKVIIPASSPLQASSPLKRRRAMTPPQGSEDLLVADSEAESECSPRKPMVSLSRFAFSG